MRFVAAGFDLAQFWSLTPRLYLLMMRGARDRDRDRLLSMAEAIRAANRLDGDAYLHWRRVVCGEDPRLPPEALAGMLDHASAGLPRITMAEALKRMH